MKYQIKCDFKERLIEIDIARFLGSLPFSNGKFYHLENADEQLTGADLISVDSHAIPIYIQTKVSQGLKTISNVPSSNRKNRSPLENVREYRHKLSLDNFDDYFLYFELRKKAPTADDFQHNILMKYANTGFSHAFYVAPLLIEKNEYEKQFLDVNNLPIKPFYHHRYWLNSENWTSFFGFIPFLRNHISIIPHEHVVTHKHLYAYSKDGIDVTWHSPEFIDEYPSRLSDRLEIIMRDFYYSKQKETIRTLAKKLRKMPIMNKVKINSDNEIDVLSKHGKLLENKFGIKQLLFIEAERK